MPNEQYEQPELNFEPVDHRPDWRRMVQFCEKEIDYWLDYDKTTHEERLEAITAYAEIRFFYRQQLKYPLDELDLMVMNDVASND